MRNLVLIIMLFGYISLSGQKQRLDDIPKDILNHLNEMGVDGTPLLNSHESAFLNVIFKDSLNGFVFTNKKVAFIPKIKLSLINNVFLDTVSKKCVKPNFIILDN